MLGIQGWTENDDISRSNKWVFSVISSRFPFTHLTSHKSNSYINQPHIVSYTIQVDYGNSLCLRISWPFISHRQLKKCWTTELLTLKLGWELLLNIAADVQ